MSPPIFSFGEFVIELCQGRTRSSDMETLVSRFCLKLGSHDSRSARQTYHDVTIPGGMLHYFAAIAGRQLMFVLSQNPTQDERDALWNYFHLMSRLYPCGECAAEFQLLLQKYPPQVSFQMREKQMRILITDYQTSSRRAAATWYVPYELVLFLFPTTASQAVRRAQRSQRSAGQARV